MIGNVFSSSAFTDILRSDLDPFGALTELVAKEFRDRFLAVLHALDVQSAAPLVGIQSIDRTTTFAETDQTARQSFAQFTDSIGERIGPDAAVSLSSPLLLAFEEIDFLQVVLHQFFIVFVFIFAAIGCVVLWTTSSAQVQELSTTSEIMRTLGMPRSQVQMFGCLISLRYLVVGIVLGTLLTGAGLLLISKTLSKFLRMPARAITFVPVLLAVVLGVVVPCLGSLLPCSRIAALSSRRNPRQRIGKKESSIIVKRLQNFGWNVSVLAAASIMTIYGAVFYFFLPKSFLEEDYSLFFGIMNISVTGIILGLVFILQPLQECVQYVFAFIFVSIGKACNFIGRISTRSERCLFSCVRRNMKNHRRRNRDAALVLSFSMALLMFAWSFTKVQIVGITESIRESLGSDIVLTARDRSIPLNETLLREHMKDLSIQNVVKKFTFITFPLFKKLQVTGIAEWPISEPLQVYGIDKYFFETVFQDITILSRNPMDPDSDETLFQLLQKSPDPKAEQNEAMLESKALNTIPVSLSEGFRNVFALESSSVLQLRMQSLSFMATAPILVEKLPAFIFSKFASTISTSPLVVSEASFRRFYEVLGQRLDTEGNSMLLEESMNKEMSPKQRLLILLQPGSSTRAVKDHIQMFGTDRLIVRDIEGNLEEVYGLEKMLMAVNAVSLIMLSLLSGSMLFVVFHENGKAANWEMGLLRALGLTNKQVFQILSYEYVSLTLSGLLSGSTVGIVASFVLVLQDELFRGIRQKISFPFLPNVILCFASLLTAMISTALAWRKICSSEACAILRGG
ncbi:unnamed protein product [Chondrus crispus]|uniref:ABC3 transporter permease C-terminal domain-containing protein n=1 Tax=Chondrus crispus TaxID=2769 RepID=R7Q4B9_CHOCR|nr:unnamed protein product [Chondrus crispus]CDF32315.1 unnamed protein product [Chondrus crispus]|eukprot:XP_005711980.1 unnamed protein product [Chondrus crispus]